jgi:methylisocitrate lyase
MYKQGLTKPRLLRDLIARRVVAMPGAHNALTAMQIERVGFDAVYISGAGLSAARGLPDIGLMSMAEVVADAKIIANAVSIPTLADADTGYGGPLHVVRTVQEFERAGLAGIHLEDQLDPKRCGHLSGKQLISSTDMATKIVAAVEARRDPDFFIAARTDARGVEGFDEAVARACAYVKAGADAIFPEALESVEEFRTFAERIHKEGVKATLIANMTEFGKSPYLSVRELEDLGYRIVLFPVTALRIAAKAVEEMLHELRAMGIQRSVLEKMQTRQELYELLRYETYTNRDKSLSERYGRKSKD